MQMEVHVRKVYESWRVFESCQFLDLCNARNYKIGKNNANHEDHCGSKLCFTGMAETTQGGFYSLDRPSKVN